MFSMSMIIGSMIECHSSLRDFLVVRDLRASFSFRLIAL